MKGSDRMKKIINSLFMFILGGIIFGSIVYATTYYAKDISYEPTDASWGVTNVNDALNSLYENSKSNGSSTNELHLIGSYYGLYNNKTATIDLSSVPNYQNLEYGKNVIAVPTAGYYHTGVSSQQWRGWSFSAVYDNQTGILTLTLSASDNYNDGYSYNVYVVY